MLVDMQLIFDAERIITGANVHDVRGAIYRYKGCIEEHNHTNDAVLKEELKDLAEKSEQEIRDLLAKHCKVKRNLSRLR